MDNPENQQRGSTAADCPTHNHPPAEAYASTSKNTKNPDIVVISTLSIFGHLTLTLFDSGSMHLFISTVFIRQVKFVLEPLCMNFLLAPWHGWI